MKINKLNKYIFCNSEEFYEKDFSKTLELKCVKLTEKEERILNYALALNGSKNRYFKV